MWFELFSIAIILPKHKKNRNIFINSSSKFSQNNKNIYYIKILSYLAFSQIWLNLPLYHRHFGYNTKLPPEKALLRTAHKFSTSLCRGQPRGDCVC
jgi:hypothetical protein